MVESIGKIVIGAGLLAVIIGGLLLLLGKAGLSSLPGDMSFGKGNFKVFFPLGTSILISIVLTIVLTVLSRSR